MGTKWKPPEKEGDCCPLEVFLDTVGGKWRCIILWWLMDGPKRFTELRRAMPGITQKMLTQQLRELERHELVTREIFAEVPPKVVYEATAKAKTINKLLKEMHKWSLDHLVPGK